MFNKVHGAQCQDRLTLIEQSHNQTIRVNCITNSYLSIVIEPPRQPLSGEFLTPDRQDEARADIHTSGFAPLGDEKKAI